MHYAAGLTWAEGCWQPAPAFDVTVLPQPNVYTTLLWPCSAWHLTAHQQRLRQNALWLGVDPATLANWTTTLPDLPCGVYANSLCPSGLWRVRITVIREATQINATPHQPGNNAPLRLTTHFYQRPDASVKHGNLTQPVQLLAAARQKQFQDVILLNGQGEMTETAFGAIALQPKDGIVKNLPREGWLFTPPDLALPSITAQWFQHWLDNCHIPWQFGLCQVKDVQAMVCLSAVRGITPVQTINNSILSMADELPQNPKPCQALPG